MIKKWTCIHPSVFSGQRYTHFFRMMKKLKDFWLKNSFWSLIDREHCFEVLRSSSTFYVYILFFFVLLCTQEIIGWWRYIVLFPNFHPLNPFHCTVHFKSVRQIGCNMLHWNWVLLRIPQGWCTDSDHIMYYMSWWVMSWVGFRQCANREAELLPFYV